MSRDAAGDGLAMRKQVLGADFVGRSLANVTDYRRPLMELVTEYGWGSVWTRPGLDRPSRSLITIAAMVATRQQDELRVHVRGALRQGVTPEQIQETVLQMAVYCGAPTAAEAFATVEAAIADLGDEIGKDVAGADLLARSGVYNKIVLLFAAPNGEPSNELSAALHGEAARISAELGHGLTSRAGIGLTADAAHDALVALGSDGRSDFGMPGYQGMLWVAGPAGSMAALLAAVDGVGARLGSLVDLAASAAVAGTEEVFLPGNGPYMGLYAVRRRPGDSYEQFHDFWRLEHTKMSMHIPGFRYRQLHAVGYASRQAAAGAGVGISDVDGIIEYFFDDISYQVEMTQLENFGEIYADEKNFIDHDRATFTYVDLRSEELGS